VYLVYIMAYDVVSTYKFTKICTY